MATMTYHSAHFTESRSFNVSDKVKNLFAEFIEAQQKKAQAHANDYLLRLDHQRLSHLGFSNIEIQRLKGGETLASIRNF